MADNHACASPEKEEAQEGCYFRLGVHDGLDVKPFAGAVFAVQLTLTQLAIFKLGVFDGLAGVDVEFGAFAVLQVERIVALEGQLAADAVRLSALHGTAVGGHAVPILADRQHTPLCPRHPLF